MSNLVYPTLVGLALKVSREAVEKTAIEESISGKELRSSWSLLPRYRFRLRYELLRTTATDPEFQTLFGFMRRHAGALDSFLFRDPGDYQVTDHGFAVGDGTTTTFQLQRTLGGSYSTALGTFPYVTRLRRNHVAQPTNVATWDKNTGVSVVSNAAVAPDGTLTAARVYYDGTGGVSQWRVSTWASLFTPAVGAAYTVSIYLRAEQPVTVRLETAYGSTDAAVTTAWQRFSYKLTGGTADIALQVASPWGVNTPFTVEVWGGQIERYSDATEPMLTGRTNVAPNYWPVLSDGFEPVYEVGPDFTLYQDDGTFRRQLYRHTRTNLVRYSDDFSNAAWVKQSVTVSANITAAPDGTNTADALIEDTTSNTHRTYQSVSGLADNTIYTVSCYVKNGSGSTRTWGLEARTKSDAYATCFFSLSANSGAGSVTQKGASAIDATITRLSNYWYRLTMTFNTGSGAITPYVMVGPAVGNAFSYQGDGTTASYVWGYQLEAGAAATSPVSTTTAAVSRTDYTLGAYGAITLATALPTGSWLSWSGTFYKRCRFARDELGADRLFQDVWETGQVDLISVKV